MVKLFLVCLTAIIIADLKYCTPIIELRMRFDFIQSMHGPQVASHNNPDNLKIVLRSPYPQQPLPPLPQFDPEGWQ